jgi:CRISPR-associated protein Cas1
MIKRTLYFGNDAYLHTIDKQLVIDFADDEKDTVTVPVEDIGVVILDAFRLTVSLNLITRLLHNNVALITCDERHMPQGLMLNLDGNTIQQERFNAQIEASQPLKKQMWQQTVKAKIRNQRKALLINRGRDSESHSRFSLENMEYWEKSVRSGDPDNYEARAAAFYWSRFFLPNVKDFRRGRFEGEPNNLLNYAYAILRAVTARSLVASGLLPTLGIHHHNKYNAYALADDIMEPYRPYADLVVKEIVDEYYTEDWDVYGFELTPAIKRIILKIPAMDVTIDGNKSPLMIAMQRTTASVYSCFAGESRKILYPEL